MTYSTKKLTDLQYYRQMFLIRRFEEIILELTSTGLLHGTTHTCIGQEHIAVATIGCLDKKIDIVFSNHRCHGHFLAYTDDPYILACELMGRKDGVNRGVGGSQHISYKNFYTNGVQGGIVANATGAAFAEKLRLSKAVTIVFMGDGTLGEGIVYESLNMASLYDIPIIYVLENNQYAQSTPVKMVVAGSMKARFEAFNISSIETSDTDPGSLCSTFKSVVDDVRKRSKPASIIIHTYRLGPHSKGDDFREEAEISQFRKNDPLKLLRYKLNSSEINKIEKIVELRLKLEFETAEKSGLTEDLIK